MTRDPAALLQLSDVFKSYAAPGQQGPGTAVLEGVCLTLRPAETLAIVGPSGSGKSTLLHLAGALDRPDHGEVWIDGENVAALGEEERTEVRRRKVGFVFQSHHLLPQCTALENVLVPTLVRSTAAERSDARGRGRRLLEAVGLGDRLDHRPAQLSGGECQRVAVVRALIHAPRILLADEPTGSLDSRTSAGMATLFHELHDQEGIALLIVTHSPALAAEMDSVVELSGGRLVRSGP